VNILNSLEIPLSREARKIRIYRILGEIETNKYLCIAKMDCPPSRGGRCPKASEGDESVLLGRPDVPSRDVLRRIKNPLSMG
jgi:hypothetical protein